MINETLFKIKTAYKQVAEKEGVPDFNKDRANTLMTKAVVLSGSNIKYKSKEVLSELLIILDELKTIS